MQFVGKTITIIVYFEQTARTVSFGELSGEGVERTVRSEPLQLQGLCWALLGKLLGVEGMCWNLLASAERRAKRAPFGERREPLQCKGLCWDLLVRVGICWRRSAAFLC